MLELIKKSLLLKLIATFTAVSFITGLMLLIYFSLINKKEIINNHVNVLNNLIDQSKKNYSTPLYNFDTETISKLNQAVLLTPAVTAINVYSASGFESGLQKNNFKETHSSYTVLTEPFTRSADGEVYKKISYNITENDRDLGRLEIFYTDYFINQEILNTGIRILIIFIVVSVTFFSFLYFILKKSFLKPVIHLANTTRIIGEDHNFSLKLEKNSEDEIGMLYDNFNFMMQNILHHETELVHVKNYLHNIIESMPSMLITIDDNEIVTQWNQAAVLLTGIPSPDVIGKNIMDVTPMFNEFLEKSRESISNNKAISFYRQQFKDNDHFMNISLYPLTANGARGVVIRVDDISELEQKDEQLRQIQKMETIGTLAGGLAHDFNNVLGGISGVLSLLRIKIQKGTLNEAKLDEYIDTMESSTNRAADMARQLLMLSRREETAFTVIDLNEVVKHISKICQSTMDKSIQLNIEPLDKPVLISGDYTQIEQILLNLCINATHAMTIMRKKDEPQEGRLTLKIDKILADKYFLENHPEAKEISYWRISVGDTGVGMDSKTIAKIFDPFFTTKDQNRGTGLGLSVVYTTIQKHYGFIDVYSEPGLGSEFTIYLPSVQGDEKIIYESKTTFDEGHGLILVIDDEETIRSITKDILEECGYNVIQAENGFEGIGQYIKNKEDIKLVIVDMIMPVKSGLETCMELKKINPQVKILLTSGFKKDERIDEIMSLGINDFIQKPYTTENLSKAVYGIIYQYK